MFIGHLALAFASKRVAPAVSLGTLILACQLADIVWPNFVLLGVERVEIAPGITQATPLDFVSYPYSHSLVALAGWSVAAAAIYRILRGARATTVAMAVIAALVLSHWVLDVISHRPDMPVTIGGTTRLGFELWASTPATMVVENLMLGIGVWLYLRSTRAADRTGSLALAGLILFLLVVHVSSLLGPPPPSSSAVAWTAQSMWLLVAWGYWIDRHRTPVTTR